MGDVGAPEGRRQGALDWSLQLRRGATGALPGDGAHYVAAAALFGDFRGSAGSAIAVLPGARNRRDRVFADEVRIAGRQDDAGAGGGATGGRFPPPRPGLPGTAVDAESGAGRIDEANWRAPWAFGGRSRHRVGTAPSGGDGRHRGDAKRGAGGWGGGGAGIPVNGGRDRSDR